MVVHEELFWGGCWRLLENLLGNLLGNLMGNLLGNLLGKLLWSLLGVLLGNKLLLSVGSFFRRKQSLIDQLLNFHLTPVFKLGVFLLRISWLQVDGVPSLVLFEILLASLRPEFRK